MNDDKKALENLLLDIDVLNDLNKWTRDINFFELSGMTRREIKHSNTLAWFFDPNENHSLGDEFLRRFLQTVISDNTEVNTDLNIFDVSLIDYSTFSIKREWNNIDILFISEELKIVIAIENKVYASESPKQLSKYFQLINEQYKDYKKCFIFLTLDGTEPSDQTNWCVANYGMIIKCLDDILSTKTNLSPKTQMIITDYINMIRRNFGMDKELKELAQRIYSKHKKAFDLIFEATSNNISQFSDYIQSWLKINSEKYQINFNPELSVNSLVRFTTPYIDQMFPFEEEKNDGWNFGHSFMYEIRVRKDVIDVVGTLANFNRTNSQAFINFAKGRDASKWKRVMTKKVLMKEEDIAEGLTDEIKDKLDKSLASMMENYILKFENEIKTFIETSNNK